jgi:iron-sulfur cluster repair protein YtfE (RIC family)
MDTPVADARIFGSVTAYLGWDHDRLDRALRLVSSAVAKGRLADAADRYEVLEPRLLHHFRMEDELLFPVFEASLGMGNGPTAVMCDEHRHARTALAMMRDALRRSDARSYEEGLRYLQSVLPDHNAREERILYPALDSLLRPSERARLVERLQREALR